MPPALIERLRQRKLVQWAVAYLAAAWLALQVLSLVAEPFAWPDLVLRTATVLLGIGFFAALVLAWYHGEKGAQRVSGVELLMLAGILSIAGVAVAFVGRDREPARAFVAGTTSVAEQGSIAVLPFADLSPKRDQEYFADGLAEELLNVLSRFPELRVASRTSAFSFRGQDVRVDSIARALHVAYVLEGSVRKAGDRVRITAQLVDAGTGYHRWSDTYDRDLKDVFAVQDEISRAIVGELRVRLAAGRADSPLARAETADPEAHALLLRALALRLEDTPEAVNRSVDLLRQVIRRDPDYARAHAELGATIWRGAYMRYIPFDSGYPEAKAEAERALLLDSTQVEAHVVLGRVAEYVDWDWRGAEGHYRRALLYNPNHAPARSALAMLLVRLGRPADAVAEAQRALGIDPLSAPAFNSLGNVYLLSDRYEEALRSYLDGLAVRPANISLLVNSAVAYGLLGRHDEAARAMAAAAQLARGVDWIPGYTGYLEALAGRRAEADQALRQLGARPAVSPYLSAMIHAALGRNDSALILLERAVDMHDDFVPDLAIDPVFARLRSDPRMQRLVRRVGVER